MIEEYHDYWFHIKGRDNWIICMFNSWCNNYIIIKL